MSQENVERTLAGWDFVNRTGRVDFDMLRPDVIWHARKDLPDPRTYRGHEGVAELLDQWTDTFEDFGVRVEEVIDAGDLVVTVLRVHGRIGGSDQGVEMAETQVGRWIDGQLAEVHEYATKTEALKAVGLHEQA